MVEKSSTKLLYTMGEVAEKRPVSLKFYIFGGYRGDNNILKAAAKVIYEQLQTAA